MASVNNKFLHNNAIRHNVALTSTDKQKKPIESKINTFRYNVNLAQNSINDYAANNSLKNHSEGLNSHFSTSNSNDLLSNKIRPGSKQHTRLNTNNNSKTTTRVWTENINLVQDNNNNSKKVNAFSQNKSLNNNSINNSTRLMTQQSSQNYNNVNVNTNSNHANINPTIVKANTSKNSQVNKNKLRESNSRIETSKNFEINFNDFEGAKINSKNYNSNNAHNINLNTTPNSNQYNSTNTHHNINLNTHTHTNNGYLETEVHYAPVVSNHNQNMNASNVLSTQNSVNNNHNINKLNINNLYKNNEVYNFKQGLNSSLQLKNESNLNNQNIKAIKQKILSNDKKGLVNHKNDSITAIVNNISSTTRIGTSTKNPIISSSSNTNRAVISPINIPNNNSTHRGLNKKDKSLISNNVSTGMNKKILGQSNKDSSQAIKENSKNTISSIGNAKASSSIKSKKPSSSQMSSGNKNVMSIISNNNKHITNSGIIGLTKSKTPNLNISSHTNKIILNNTNTNIMSSINNKFISNNNEYSKQQSKSKYSANYNSHVAETCSSRIDTVNSLVKPIIKDNSHNNNNSNHNAFKITKHLNYTNNSNNITYCSINNLTNITNTTTEINNNLNHGISLKKELNKAPNKAPQSRKSSMDRQLDNKINNTNNCNTTDSKSNDILDDVLLRSSGIKQTEESLAETERLYDFNNKKLEKKNSSNINSIQNQSKNNSKGVIASSYGTNITPSITTNTISNYMMKYSKGKQNSDTHNYKQLLQSSNIKINSNNSNSKIPINSNYVMTTGNSKQNTKINFNSNMNINIDDKNLKTEASRKSLITINKNSMNNYHSTNTSNSKNLLNKKPVLIRSVASSNNHVINNNMNKKSASAMSYTPQCIEINYNSQANKNSLLNNTHLNNNNNIIHNNNLHGNHIINNNSRPSTRLNEKSELSNKLNIKSPENIQRKAPQTEKNSPKNSTNNIHFNINPININNNKNFNNANLHSKINFPVHNNNDSATMKKIASKYPSSANISPNNINVYNSNHIPSNILNINSVNKNNYNDKAKNMSKNNNNTNHNNNYSTSKRKNSDKENQSIIENSLAETDCNSFKKEADILIDYIKKYYSKHDEYPATSIKFYKFGRLLGRGAFGKVNLGLHTLTGRLVAIKSFNKSLLSNERSHRKILHEVNLMRKLRQNSVVKIFETFETSKYIIIIMEYVSGGDLLSYVKKRTKLTEPVAKYLFKQIVLALEYTHSQNIIHRDIKLDNILLDIHNNIKICDFGVGKQIKSRREIMYDQCGTPAYIAPEILKGSGYEGPPVDFWSAGVVLYAMLSGTVPFKANDMNELHKIICSGEFTEIEGVSKEVNNLLHGVLEVDPKKRLGADEILNHPWMYDADENGTNYKMELFANAEKLLLAKSDIDYRKADKENILENFTLKNLETKNDLLNKNVITRSNILAPFNSSLKNSLKEDYFYDIPMENNFIKLIGKVKEANHQYELNNNCEIDNGVIIPKNLSKELKKDSKSGLISPCEINSNIMSPPDFSHKVSAINTPRSDSLTNRNLKPSNPFLSSSTLIIDDQAIKMTEKVGFLKEYIMKCLGSNEINQATTCYYIFNLTKE